MGDGLDGANLATIGREPRGVCFAHLLCPGACALESSSTMTLNPYAAPTESETEDLWNRCPVCQSRVLRLRFTLPFGYCGSCGNYLAVRNWQGRTFPWVLALVATVVVPIPLNVLGIQLSPRVVPLLVVALWVWLFIHNKVWGVLVPAVCWGLYAVRDDDRFPKTEGKTKA